MSVYIVDCGSGNLRSAAKALERAVSLAELDLDVAVGNDPAMLDRASHIVLPGQGAFRDCMTGILSVPGLREALERAVVEQGKPFFGICVGMQLMVQEGREYGVTPGLGWLPGACVPLAPADQALKIPHMGWNDLVVDAPDHPVLAGVVDGNHAYFVHSYQVAGVPDGALLAHADYAGRVTAIIGRDNMVGTQFHAEKSQATGLALLANFVRWRP